MVEREQPKRPFVLTGFSLTLAAQTSVSLLSYSPCSFYMAVVKTPKEARSINDSVCLTFCLGDLSIARVWVRGRTSTRQEESKEQVGLTHSQVFSKEGIQSREAPSASQITPTFPVATGSRTRA